MKFSGNNLKKQMIWGSFFSNVVFPLALLLFPLVKANQGIDLTDTGYSLGNYRFFTPNGGIWTLLTFLLTWQGLPYRNCPMAAQCLE